MTAGSAIARWQRAVTAVLATAALVTAALAALLAGQLPRAAAAEAGMGPMSTATAQQFTEVLRGLRGQQFEATFMAEMIPHHQGAVDMASMQVQRGAHPELKQLAGQIVSSQRQQIQQMTGWLRAWYGLTPEQAMAQAPALAQQLMQQLDAEMAHMMAMLRDAGSGAAFDRVFLEQMVSHHESAVTEGQVAVTNATHPELRALGQDIVASQQREIGQMTAWLQQWYGVRLNTENGGRLAPTASRLPLIAAAGGLLIVLAAAGLLLTRRTRRRAA